MMYRRLDTSSAAESPGVPHALAIRARDLMVGALAGALIGLSFVWARPAGARVIADTWNVPGFDDATGKGPEPRDATRARASQPLSPSWIWDRKPIRNPRP